MKTASLVHYYRNARIGNIDAIAESLEVNGQYKPIVINAGTHTGRKNEVLVGNHTLSAALQLGWVEIQAVVVDVDNAGARRIVLVDNRTSDLAGYDNAALADLLAVADLTGTGYDVADLAGLLDTMTPATDDEWADGFAKVPEGEQAVFTVSFSLNAEQHAALSAALDRAAIDGEPEGNRMSGLLERITTAYTGGN